MCCRGFRPAFFFSSRRLHTRWPRDWSSDVGSSDLGELVRLPRTVGPRAQQTCLPAAGRSRDDCHPPRRRAIQGSYKITPVDQPGSCWSHRQRPSLISTPDTPSVGHAVLAPSLGTRPAHVLSTAREPRFCCTLIHARRDPIPSAVVPVRRITWTR